MNSPIVAEIIQLWRMRQRWHRAEKSLILQGRALCRAWTAGDKEAANKLFDLAADGKSEDPVLELALMPFLKAIGNFKPERAAVEKRLKKLAQSLPVWPWVASVKGFGPMNLAALVGEAGDIGSYRNPSCLWKRMGMAVIDGERQRKCADADKALRHGYNPARRAVAYLIGETLLKAGTRERYDTRRAHTAETHPEWPKARSHNDALRVNAKDILRRLWAAWRGSDGVAEEIGT